MPELSPTHNQPEFTVSELSQAIKRSVEEGFGYVRVRGEISGWRGPHSSGHAYFRLKDDKAVLEAVCWKGTLSKVGCKPEEGLEVVASGRITTYPGSSKYQIVIERMEPAGVGALMALLEKRRQMLAAEGLFDESRKKKLPYLPRVIGVVTSPTGAVIRDILHRISDRFPVHVLVWPVAVQGEGAAAQVADAIAGFNQLPPLPPGEGRGEGAELPRKGPFPHPTLSRGERAIFAPDIIIVARGGGSLEDLWAFNEEVVVRAVAASKIPVISAVGHETDTTLIDFVSDLRAPTPTAAAEMAVPVRSELLLLLQDEQQRLNRGLLTFLSERQERVVGLARGLPNPARILEHITQRLDDWSERLHLALPALIRLRSQQLQALTGKLTTAALRQSIDRHMEEVKKLSERASRMVLRHLQDQEKTLQQAARLLNSMDFKKVLERGFALVRDEKGKLVKSAAGNPASITFADGEIKVNKA